MEWMQLEIQGMNCEHCVAAVTRALTSLAGVKVDRVAIGSATLEFDPRRTTPDAIMEAVSDEGYSANRAA